MAIVARKVRTITGHVVRWHDGETIERVRRLRNSVRSYMTRHTDYITPGQQELWALRALDPERGDSTLLAYQDGLGQFVGYGVMRRERRRLWLTAAVVSNRWGSGYGRALFGDMIRRAGDEACWLEVRTTNIRARALYHDLGFRPVPRRAADPGVIVLRRMAG